MTKTIEILAPGRNSESSKEAIKCGADAIYIASEGFGLRKDFDNTIEEIKELVEFAHKYWVKVYVTVNSLIFNEADFEKIEKLINDLYKIEVDAIIILDMGILELNLPPIPLVASTYTSCFTPEKAKFLEKVGFSMAVLPRELTIQEIKKIADNTNIKLEVFCYGLLCVGYGGKCYLQYTKNLNAQKGEDILDCQYNAANNGKCDQHCMDFYNLIDADGNYIEKKERLLNLRFNNQSENLLELFDAGVTSFKIEGRHKELSYVKNTTAYFRQKADGVIKLRNLKKASSGNCILNFEPDLAKTFNKGYTDYFIHGRKKEMYSVNDIAGDFVGAAVNFKNYSFEIDSNTNLSIGDKLRYRDKDNKVKSIHITKKNNCIYTCTETEDNLEGINLYRYFDAEANYIIKNSKNFRVIPVKIEIEEESDLYKINAYDEDNNKICLNYKKTQNSTSKKDLSEELAQIDIDEFVFEDIGFSGEYLYMNAKSIREQMAEKLRETRKINRPKLEKTTVDNDCKYPDKITYLDNLVNSKAEKFYQRHGVTEIEKGMETNKIIKGKQILTGKYCIKNELNFCTKTCPTNPPPEPWYLEDTEGKKHQVIFDCTKCEMKIIHQ